MKLLLQRQGLYVIMMTMHLEIRDILNRSARKLLITRMCETAAIAATAGGVAASALIVVSMAIKLWFPGLAGGLNKHLPAYWPVALIGLAGIFGAAVRYFVGVSLHDVAVWLDSAGHLKQRLTTAEELLDTDQKDSPAAVTVFSQALSELKKTPLQKMPMWRLGPATIAGLCLVTILTLALSLISSSAGVNDAQFFADTLAHMSPAQRLALIDALKSARQDTDAQQRNLRISLAEAATAVQLDDNDKFSAALARARQEGFVDLQEILPGELAGEGGGDISRAKLRGQHSRPAEIRTHARNADRQLKTVRVYDRLYQSSDQHDKSLAENPAAVQVEYDRAWASARRRATDKLSAGTVPNKYRTVLRNFFVDN